MISVDCHAIRQAALDFGDLPIDEAFKAARDIAEFVDCEMIEIEAFKVEQTSQFFRQVVVIVTGKDGETFGRVCDLARPH